jgi:SOS response regulatory protein OraA/RecX
MLRWPWVSRHAYDLVVEQLQQRTAAHDRLVQQMVGLKRKGFEPSQAGKIRKQPDEEAQALASVEQKFVERVRASDRDFVDSAVQDLIDRGLSPDAAKREAKRIRAEITDSQPAGG